MNNTGKTLD